MTVRRLAPPLLAVLALLLLSGTALGAPTATARPTAPVGSVVVPAAHYQPAVGDSLSFTESISVGGGEGNYTGYWETQDVNGTLTITTVPGNGTDTASYDYANHYWNSTGGELSWIDSGTFTFSTATFLYLRSTDNQTGLNRSEVWFYINNTLSTGASIDPLETPMTITSRSADYDLGTGAGGFVSTIEAVGTGTYPRDDYYGDFTANYVWRSYFDPATGYIVGYTYLEHDHNSQGDGFVYADTLRVTDTSFPLTAGKTEATYSVDFTETGLPATTGWTVIFNGILYPGAGPTITVTAVPNGTYAFLLTARGYTASSPNGSLTVDGPPSSPLASSWSVFPAPAAPIDPWPIIIGVVVLLLLVALLVWALTRRRHRPASSLPTHSAGGTPQYAPLPTGAPPPPISLAPGDQPRIQQVVVQEVVKVKCQYCGSLIDSTAPTCPFCGATRT